MNVLMITGDASFGPGHPRYDMQRAAVDRLEVIYWGRGCLLPKLPKGSFDVVTAQDPFMRGHLAAHIAWWLGARLNVQVHTTLSAHSPLVRAWAGFNLRKASSVRVVSPEIKAQVIALGVETPVFVLPIFVDVGRFRTVSREPHPQKTILWIGRFEKEKAPLRAIDALKRVRGSGSEAKLIMLGAGSLGPALREAAIGLPVEFPGWKDTAEFLSVADVVLCTSQHESWGASMVEALAAGVPVVAPDVGVAREAGAHVVDREKLAETIVGVLKSGERGMLKLRLSDAPEWVKRWCETLSNIPMQ